MTPNADVVVEIEQLHQVPRRSQVIGPEVDLNPPAGVLEMTEHHLPLGSPGLDPAGNLHRRSLVAHVIPVGPQGFGCGVSPVESIGERLDAERLDGATLLPAMAFRLAQLPGHAAWPPYRFRKASMKASRSPSITR